jgi:hypothetical protein
VEVADHSSLVEAEEVEEEDHSLLEEEEQKSTSKHHLSLRYERGVVESVLILNSAAAGVEGGYKALLSAQVEEVEYLLVVEGQEGHSRLLFSLERVGDSRIHDSSLGEVVGGKIERERVEFEFPQREAGRGIFDLVVEPVLARGCGWVFVVARMVFRLCLRESLVGGQEMMPVEMG